MEVSAGVLFLIIMYLAFCFLVFLAMPEYPFLSYTNKKAFVYRGDDRKGKPQHPLVLMRQTLLEWLSNIICVVFAPLYLLAIMFYMIMNWYLERLAEHQQGYEE